jgi:hypothetical protein
MSESGQDLMARETVDSLYEIAVIYRQEGASEARQVFVALLLQHPEWTLKEIAEFAALVQADMSRFRQCEECRSIYLQTGERSYHRFCSVRCGNRVRAREYQRRKAHGTETEIDVIEPGSMVCSACGGDLVDGPGCSVCGDRDGEGEA